MKKSKTKKTSSSSKKKSVRTLVCRRHRRVTFDPVANASSFNPSDWKSARGKLVRRSIRGSTRKQYESRIRVMKRWLRARGLRHMTKPLVFLFFQDLHTQGVKSLSGFRAALLFRQKKDGDQEWAADADVIAASTPAQPNTSSEKGVLTGRMFEDLLLFISKKKKPSFLRLAVLLLFAARLRISELQKLKRGDIQPDSNAGSFVIFVRIDKRSGGGMHQKPLVAERKIVEEIVREFNLLTGDFPFPKNIPVLIRDLLSEASSSLGWPEGLDWHATHVLRFSGSVALADHVAQQAAQFCAQQTTSTFRHYSKPLSAKRESN